MRQILAVFWTFAVSWFFSALIHVVDSDIGHIGGLREVSVLVSVSVVALLFTVPAWLAFAAYWRRGWKVFFLVVGGLAVGIGTLLGMLSSGTPGAGSAALGLAVLFGLAITTAALVPVWAIGRA